LNTKNFNWGPALYIIGYHLLLLVGLPIYFFHALPSWQIVVTSAVLVYVTGIAVTAGYHRLYSHTTYKIHPVVESVILFFATMATQGSALRWSFDHRHHHAFVDTDKDPYSIKKGFWYAHFLWLLEKPKPIENKIVADLLKKPVLNFQHRFYGPLMFGINLLVTLFLGWCFNDYLGAFLFTWIVRMFCLHHLTWFINSLAHTWGDRPFCQSLSAVDNYLISMLTWGEGYHNYHHTFAYDYRNGIRWYHYDPTKWLIWTLSKFGLASRLKKNQSYFIEKRIITENKELLLERIQASFSESKRAWEEKLETLTSSMLDRLQEIKQAKEEYLNLKLNKEGKKEVLSELKMKIKEMKKGLKSEFKDCRSLSKEIKSYFAKMQKSRQKPLLDASS
jgi:stearoyl-CoA desaturase (Delta-9 desaturase)